MHRQPITRLIPAILVFAFMLINMALMPQPAVQAEPVAQSRHIGYGISVGPHLDSSAHLLDQLGMDWVKIYDTSQVHDFPNQRVLYRVDVRGYPEDIEGWERGLHDLARELRADGVDAVEIGNEPNLQLEWGGNTPNPRQFTDTLCRAYKAFKAEAPEIVVVAGGLAPTITTPDRSAVTDFDFAQEMFNAGVKGCFDAWAYHPYGFNQPPEADPNKNELTFRRTERMYRLLWRNGVRDKQIWITEFGWVRDPAEEGLDCANDPMFSNFNWMKFPAQVQADYTIRAFKFADSNWPWVGPMFLWNLNWNAYPSNYEPVCSHLRWYSILDSGSNPLPVFRAIEAMPKRPPVEYRPTVGAVVQSLTRTVEAGCGTTMELGHFTVLNSGYPGHLEVEIEAANGPGRPVVWTDLNEAESNTEVQVFVDASNIDPGLHLIAINLRAFGTSRMSSHVVRGWLLVHYPTSPECVANFNQ